MGYMIAFLIVIVSCVGLVALALGLTMFYVMFINKYGDNGFDTGSTLLALFYVLLSGVCVGGVVALASNASDTGGDPDGMVPLVKVMGEAPSPPYVPG